MSWPLPFAGSVDENGSELMEEGDRANYRKNTG